MDPRAGLDGCAKSRPTGIRSPDRPARSKLLYRLSYPGPLRDYKVYGNSFNRNSVPVLERVRFVPSARYFSLFEDVQTWSGAHPMGTGRSFFMSKAVGA